jgi:hypothetical protein
MNFTVKQISYWRQQAEDVRLENRQILNKYSDEELAEIFNGIGSDGFPEWLRSAISKLHPSLMAVALIHDVEWYERELETKAHKFIYPDVDRKRFHESNKRFKTNAVKMSKFRYGLIDPRRYIVQFNGWRFSKYCNSALGFKWWKE